MSRAVNLTPLRHVSPPSTKSDDEDQDKVEAHSLPVSERLAMYLRASLGTWPPRQELDVIVWPERDRPGWDGYSWPGLGIESPDGAVLSFSPQVVADSEAIDNHVFSTALNAPDPAMAMSTALGQPHLTFSRSTFRWSERPATLPEVGEWVSRDDPRIPAWLQAFNGDVLVAWDYEGRATGGVGRKIHNQYGHELAVAIESAQRGRGLARTLVAQAARRTLSEGAIPLYFHTPENIASARVADAAGFPNRGWHVIGLQWH